MKNYMTVRNAAFAGSAVCGAIGTLGYTGQPWLSLMIVGGVLYTIALLGPVFEALAE